MQYITENRCVILQASFRGKCRKFAKNR